GDAASERLSPACAHGVVVRGVQAQGGVQQLRTVRDGQHGVLESESHFGVQDGAKVGGALKLVLSPYPRPQATSRNVAVGGAVGGGAPLSALPGVLSGGVPPSLG